MAIDARIFQPAKQATSSGRFKTKFWVVEHEPKTRVEPDQLIGWQGSDDTDKQVTLRFATKEAAIAYCERQGLSFTLTEPHARLVRPKSYAENFVRRT